MSHSTRRSVVFACLIMLFAIAGSMAYVVAFAMGGSAPSLSLSASRNPASFQSAIAPIDAGAAPNVTIHDPDSKVYISTSTDGKIHVGNASGSGAWHFGGAGADLSIYHTGADVKIERARSSAHAGFGFGHNAQLSVAVPPASHVTVTDADGLEVNGVAGALSARAGSGTVRVTGTKGDLDIKAGGGRIYLTNVHAKHVVAHSYYGRLVLTDVTTEQLDADTRDGRVLVDGLTMAGDAPRAVLATQNGPISVTATFGANGTYTLRTADGHIRLRLPPTSNLTVTARAGNDGHVSADPAFTMSGDDAHRTARLGSGSAAVAVSSGDGNIFLETTGAL